MDSRPRLERVVWTHPGYSGPRGTSLSSLTNTFPVVKLLKCIATVNNRGPIWTMFRDISWRCCVVRSYGRLRLAFAFVRDRFRQRTLFFFSFSIGYHCFVFVFSLFGFGIPLFRQQYTSPISFPYWYIGVYRSYGNSADLRVSQRATPYYLSTYSLRDVLTMYIASILSPDIRTGQCLLVSWVAALWWSFMHPG